MLLATAALVLAAATDLIEVGEDTSRRVRITEEDGDEDEDEVKVGGHVQPVAVAFRLPNFLFAFLLRRKRHLAPFPLFPFPQSSSERFVATSLSSFN